MSSATVHALKQRITQMQPAPLPERALPTHPALAPLLPGGAIRAGSSYAVNGSWQLALSFLATASATGLWCGVIGCPAFGAEAAATLGIALDRCVLIPHPGEHALALAATLSEVLTITLVHTPTQPSPGVAERIAAKLRERGSALIVANAPMSAAGTAAGRASAAGSWPGAAASLRVTSSRWDGLEHGFGSLGSRSLTVSSRGTGRPTEHTLRFTDGMLSGSAATPGAGL